VDSDYIYPLPNGSIIVGREHGRRECLIGKQYVSRIHAKITVENGAVFIENLSKTNYTYVNNIRIPAGRTRLNAGDEVALGGISVNGTRQEEAAYFIVGTVQ
jgi:pSer/pThr/pTyr-binding forkhead associated (FHA) protein